MVSWGIKAIGGIDYDLTHLDAFVMLVKPNAADALTRRVLVDFGHHTFSRDLRPGDPPEAIIHHKKHQNDPRCFCPARQGLSLNLPALIRTASAGRAYFGEVQSWRPQNYLLIENVPGVVGPYAVFFDMKQSTAKNIDVLMFVNSAYPKPNLPPRIPSLPFRILVGTIAAGNPVVRPKK